MEPIITESSPLNRKEHFSQPATVRFLAHLFSYVFHPLFIPTLVTAFLLYNGSLLFAGLPAMRKTFILIGIFFNTGFLPAFSVFLMWRLKFVDSIFLRTQKERIIPYSAALIFYFWAWYVAHSQPEMPATFVQFLLGSFLAVCSAWMLNIRMKVSMHATAVGGMVMFFLLQAFTGQDFTARYIAMALLVAGLVCTSRLIVSNHTKAEIYVGFFAGMACQLIALWV